MEENEIELIDYLNILWKRKWLIIIPTFILVVAVGIYSFFLPKIYEIDAILLPSKFFAQTDQGKFEETVIVDPKQIAEQINEASYNHLIAAELNLNIKGFPKLRAENLKDTNLVRVSLREQEPEKAKLILRSLFNHLKADLDIKIDVENKGIDTQIESRKNSIKSKEVEIKDKENVIKLQEFSIKDRKNEIKTKQNRIKEKQNFIKTKENAIKLKNLNIESKEIEKKRKGKEINTLENKIKISEEREKSIREEMKEVKKRIDKIEEEQRKVLKKESDKNALSILLYSNEIQNNLKYHNTLDEKLTNEKITQENLNLTIEEKKESIKQIDNQIEQIKTRIDDTKVEMDDIRTQIDDIETQIDNIKNEIEKINYEINTVTNSITIKYNDIDNINNDISFLRERKARMDYTQLIKKPTSSLGPVSPKKRLNIIFAGIVGLLLFTLLTFFLEYIERQKNKVKAEKKLS